MPGTVGIVRNRVRKLRENASRALHNGPVDDDLLSIADGLGPLKRGALAYNRADEERKRTP